MNMSITNDVKVETMLLEFICELLTYRAPLRGFFVGLFYFWFFIFSFLKVSFYQKSLKAQCTVLGTLQNMQ